MNKSFETIKDVFTNAKHPFRKIDGHPKKAVKHRYERRKIRGYLHADDWRMGEAA